MSFKLPLSELGLKYIPAVPVDIGGMIDTLVKLGIRAKQREQALQGLTKTFTIGGSTARAYAFLFGGEAADAKPAAARERLRGFLSGNELEVLSRLPGQLKEQDKEPVQDAMSGGDD